MRLSSFTSTQRANGKSYTSRWYVTVIQLFKVIEISSNWKHICDFLLDFQCNHMPVLLFPRYNDLLVSLHFRFFAYRDSFKALAVCRRLARGFPWDIGYERWYHKNRVPELRENRVIAWAFVFNGVGLWRTDRQTDRQTDGSASNCH